MALSETKAMSKMLIEVDVPEGFETIGNHEIQGRLKIDFWCDSESSTDVDFRIITAPQEAEPSDIIKDDAIPEPLEIGHVFSVLGMMRTAYLRIRALSEDRRSTWLDADNLMYQRFNACRKALVALPIKTEQPAELRENEIVDLLFSHFGDVKNTRVEAAADAITELLKSKQLSATHDERREVDWKQIRKSLDDLIEESHTSGAYCQCASNDADEIIDAAQNALKDLDRFLKTLPQSRTSREQK